MPLGRLLAICVERTGCGHLGLLIGQRGGLESVGLIGLIAEHSPDVGTALRNLILHLHLADPELRRLLGERIAALEATGAGDLVVQVRRILHNLLLDGRGTLGQVAELFDLHRRTLNRRMREQGLTVKRLIEDVRYEIARQLLAETDLSVMELATVLGYADATAFTRPSAAGRIPVPRPGGGPTGAERRVGQVPGAASARQMSRNVRHHTHDWLKLGGHPIC